MYHLAYPNAWRLTPCPFSGPKMYHQIVSFEDHAKLCFKNECTLESVQNFTPV